MTSPSTLVRIAGPIDHPAHQFAVHYERLAGRTIQTPADSLQLATELVILPPGEGMDPSAAADLAEARRIGKPVRYWAPPHLAVLLSADTANWTVLCTTCTDGSERFRRPGTAVGCRVAEHPQLDTALQEDIYEQHGLGVFLVLTDDFHDEDLVLVMDAALPPDIDIATTYFDSAATSGNP